MLPTAKRAVNKIIGYPEQTVTTISTDTYVKGLVKDPKREVRNSWASLCFFCFVFLIRTVFSQAVGYLKGLFPILGWITRYSTSYSRCLFLHILTLIKISHGLLVILLLALP